MLRSNGWKIREICLLIDSEEAGKVRDAFLNRTCVYYPYLGKNDHPANLSAVTIEDAKIIEFDIGRLDCFAPKGEVQVADLDYDELEDMDAFSEFKYEETLPVGMDSWTNQYSLKTFLYTDALVEVDDTQVYQLKDGKKIVFY